MLKIYLRRVHFCHTRQVKEIEWIKQAKEEGLSITWEVTPHHLFFSESDKKTLCPFGRINSPLRTSVAVNVLWKTLDVIDIIASDHAPYAKEEKLLESSHFGVPGLETSLLLFLTAVFRGKLTLERLVELISLNPVKIFNLTPSQDNWVGVDVSESYLIENQNLKTKCVWSPFEGKKVTGKVRADTIVLYYSQIGASYEAAYYSKMFSEKLRKPNVPVISTGDGVGEHPPQSLLNLFTIVDRFGSVENKRVARVSEMGTPEEKDVLDSNPRFFYFHQMQNGLFGWMALLAAVF